jgi:hypothetical protein
MTASPPKKLPPLPGGAAMSGNAGRPSMGELWMQAKGNDDLFRELMLDHGYLVRIADDPEDGAGGRDLPCGFPSSQGSPS